MLKFGFTIKFRKLKEIDDFLSLQAHVVDTHSKTRFSKNNVSKNVTRKPLNRFAKFSHQLWKILLSSIFRNW